MSPAARPEGGPAEGEFRLGGVMGWPIGHSRSPVLHGHWLARYRIRGAYVPLAVRPERLGQALAALPALGFAGCNLTMPHKEAALAYLDHLEPLAARIGSANTVIVRPDGSLEGRSTDGYGFMRHLNRSSSWQPGHGPALLLGAGGAARAIAAALKDAGESLIRVVNRTDARACALADALGRGIEPWPWALRHVAVAGCRLVVNASTLGMAGEPPLELDLSLLPSDAIVADIVYTPLVTPLLAAAQARGNTAVDGLGMLLHQAEPGFAAWFGIVPVVDEAVRAAVLGSLGA
jgi:shikimate dehydrogenase